MSHNNSEFNNDDKDKICIRELIFKPKKNRQKPANFFNTNSLANFLADTLPELFIQPLIGEQTNILHMSNQLSSPTTTSSLSQSPQQTPTNKPEMRMHQTQRRAQHRANRFGASFALLLLANATLLLALTLTANADNYNAQQQIQQQPTDGYAGPQQANNGNSYNGNEQQQQQPTKAKKIQIVYIKVPLAKLKSSPMHSADLFSSNNQSSNYGTKGDSTDTKSQGSQSEQQQQNQLSSQHSSFLIPMAVVQTGQAENSNNGNEQQQVDVVGANSASGPVGKSFNSPAESSQHVSHMQPNQQMPFEADQRNQEQLFRPTNGQQFGLQQPMQLHLQSANAGRRPQMQSPMQLYHQMLSSPSVNHGINHGFMSSFLLGEKEKMSAAAMRVMQQQQQGQPQSVAPVADSSSVSGSSQSAPEQSNGNNSTRTNQFINNNQKPGGLMPFMMVPFSHMPDNAIGQAYNAAVGQALPIESGSPSSMLSSPSSMNHQQQQQHQTDNNNSKRGIQAPTAGNNQGPYGGGNAGTSGDQGTLPGTSSGASYTGSGPGQLDMHSLEKGLQQSGSAYANSGPSLGFGSGINSFGASVAFSDYPTNSGQQTYAQSPLSSSSSNSNNHQLSHSQDSSMEHAVLENNGAPLASSNQFKGGNKYGQQQPQSNSLRSHRQMSASNGKRHRGAKQAGGEYRQNGNQVPYGANSNMNEINLAGPSVDALNTGSGAQYINAANAQDINQITAAINAENAASAAAALAQADMAFGNGQAFMQQGRYNGNGNHQQQGFMRPQSQYAAGLQSAASALLSNTHPVIQAAASGGLASVSKLGAKLGEIIALPSMQVPNSIAALPSALSSITSQMAVQMNQAVQQVAKEHPTAHAFARQVAQHAGINLPNFAQAQMQPQQHQQQHNQHHQTNQMSNQQAAGQQVSAAASDQHNSIAASSPQAQLQNLKLSIGQNLQTAAAQLIGAHQKANAASSAASLLANPLAALYPQAMNAALKQLSSGMSPLVTGNNVAFAPSSLHQQQQQQSQNQNLNGEVNHMMHFQQGQQVAPQAGDSSAAASTSQQLVSSASESSGIVKPTKSSSLKSKFLAFFQPPKFISNMLSWNDRAGARSDKGPIVEKAADIEAAKALVDQTIKSSNATSTTVGSSSTAITSAPIMVSSTTLAARSNSSAGPSEEVKLAKPETKF